VARRSFSIVPVLMLAIGIAAGWWLAKRGLEWPQKAGVRKPAVPETTTAPATDIRKLDFRNFRYTPECLRNEDGSRGSLTTRGGSFERDEEFDKLTFTVGEVAYGELTGDAQDEAVVLTTCNTGGSGSFTEGFVYTLQDGQPREIGRIESGSRAYGGILSLRVRQGLVVVERYATDEDGPHCCPRYIDTTQLRWDGRHFEEVGARTRRAADKQQH
jgi:hypothetical protein